MRLLSTIASKVHAFGNLIDSTNWRERRVRPFEMQSNGPILEEVSLSDWRMLVSDSRKAYSNLGPVRGAIDDKSMNSVGNAWMPLFEGRDREWGIEARAYLVDEFYPSADIRGPDFQTHLYLQSVGIDREGDTLGCFTEHQTGAPALGIISATRITQEDESETVVKSGPYKGAVISHGIIMNSAGRPVAFRLDDGTEISARDAQLLMEPQWPDQVRGFPGMTHALLDLRDLRTVQGYEKLACALASSIGLMEYNETGMADRDDPRNLGKGGAAQPGQEPVMKEYMGGMVRYFRANTGSKIETLKNERPGDAWQQLMNRLIRNSCSGFGWPYELTWDSSQLGSANVRLILAKAMRSVSDRQSLLRPYAKRAVGYAICKAIKNGRLRPSPDWWRWGFTMPQRMTIDLGRDAASQREDLAMKITSLTDILSEQGKDLSTHVATIKEDDAALAAAGVMPDETKQALADKIIAAVSGGSITCTIDVENRLRTLLNLKEVSEADRAKSKHAVPEPAPSEAAQVDEPTIYK